MKQFLEKILCEDSTISSMRVALLFGVLTACLVFIAVLFHIVHHTVVQAKISWTDIGVFITAISPFVLALVFGKIQQKQTEQKTR